MMALRVNMDLSWEMRNSGEAGASPPRSLDVRKMAKTECVLKANKIDVMYAIA
ncbi:hypothetical protein X737_29370 [Mesorhizobium sp. L48C026A00]|nr:hypothetical protein X737_29370 [Mesorhizobium sp. L48C026A00]